MFGSISPTQKEAALITTVVMIYTTIIFLAVKIYQFGHISLTEILVFAIFFWVLFFLFKQFLIKIGK